MQENTNTCNGTCEVCTCKSLTNSGVKTVSNCHTEPSSFRLIGIEVPWKAGLDLKAVQATIIPMQSKTPKKKTYVSMW